MDKLDYFSTLVSEAKERMSDEEFQAGEKSSKKWLIPRFASK